MNDNQKATCRIPTDDVVKAARTSRIALGQLFDDCYPMVFAYCSRRLLVRATAEDVTSEVFLKVSSHLYDFSGETGEEFRAWMFRIATNEINAVLRRTIRQRELLEAAAHMGHVSSTVSTSLLASESPVEWQQVVQAISELSEREQSIIALRFFCELPHDQVAAVLKIEPGTCRVALTRALDKLRDRLRRSDDSIRSTSNTKRGGLS